MRINTLDYLRGLMAFAIMIYHYFSWTFHSYESDSILGVLGIYGVSIFYILSGLTLYYVYEEKLDLSNIYLYVLKRLFRILPLLWLSIILNIYLLNKSYDLKIIILNITGLFGFVDHGNYITTGSWSIGNELVFYSIFPIIILLNKWKKYVIESFFIVSVLIAVYFAFWNLSSSASLSSQWLIYINPLNQIYLFIGGILIGKYIGFRKNNNVGIVLFILCGVFMLFNQNNGDKISIVSEWNRILFSLISFMTTIAFLILDIKHINKTIDWCLTKLGHISYSLYLLHAIIFWFVGRYYSRVEAPFLTISICIFTTIVISYLSHRYFESKIVSFVKYYFNKK